MASDDWERHGATIESLLWLENMPLNQVVSYMRKTHELHKSKSWTNMSKEDWKFVIRQINERKGKQSEVLWLGAPLSDKQVQRGTQRYKALPRLGNRRESEGSVHSGLTLTTVASIVRVRTPPVIELDVSWPSTLPWFSFKNRVFPTLRNTSGILRTFFDIPIQYDEIDTVNSLYMAWKISLKLRQAINDLSNTIPDDLIDRQRKASALVRNSFAPCLVTIL
ncbi:hypothetical protein F4801DRAFT_603730 [Xylaria longipes]|nr:hypothetical protein F4801DRAFT_603730 [Xylaria longipes]